MALATYDNEKRYSVWVGGGEVNDYFLSLDEAKELAEEYMQLGYDDTQIVKN